MTALTSSEGVDPLLFLDGVTKRWHPEGPAILDAVSLTLDDGSAVGISGRNGIGKTTLLRVIAGLLVPDSGTVALDGWHAGGDRTEVQRRVGFLSAGNGGLYARLDVDANLMFWARIALIPRRMRAAAIDVMLDQFQLHELRGRRVDRLSMGQRQRLRLALTFLHRPRLVLLDEPCTSLDEVGVRLVHDALLAFRAAGGSAIVCSPDSEVERLGLSRGMAMTAGQLEPST